MYPDTLLPVQVLHEFLSLQRVNYMYVKIVQAHSSSIQVSSIFHDLYLHLAFQFLINRYMLFTNFFTHKKVIPRVKNMLSNFL